LRFNRFGFVQDTCSQVPLESLTRFEVRALLRPFIANSGRPGTPRHAAFVPEVSTVYTFGEPRTGNSEFAGLVNVTTASVDRWRVVNKDDIVPHLPPRKILGQNYTHINSEIWMTPPDGKLKVRLLYFVLRCTPPNDFPNIPLSRPAPIVSSSAKVCDGSGEDPTCSDSVPDNKWSITDHTSYFGLDAGPCPT
jgi:hypothetical protein